MLLTQSALDDVEEHLQPFLEAGPKEITAQVQHQAQVFSSADALLVAAAAPSKPSPCLMGQAGRCGWWAGLPPLMLVAAATCFR
jgi:hypothetical protein